MNEIWKNLHLNQWKMEHNYLLNDLGRLWMLYDSNPISLQVIERNSQFIHCQITWENEIFL